MKIRSLFMALLCLAPLLSQAQDRAAQIMALRNQPLPEALAELTRLGEAGRAYTSDDLNRLLSGSTLQRLTQDSTPEWQESERAYVMGLAEFLIAHPAVSGAIDARDAAGMTLLLSAAHACDYQAALFLMNHGAAYGIRSPYGRSAADLARETGSTQVTTYRAAEDGPARITGRNWQADCGNTLSVLGATDTTTTVIERHVSVYSR
jgi:hypothetical protein